MKKIFIFLSLFIYQVSILAQVVSTSSFTVPQRPCDTRLNFKWHDEGIATPIEWGIDACWCDEPNMRRSVQFAGNEIFDMVRVSYMPSGEIKNNQLTDYMLERLNQRVDLVKKYLKPTVKVNINDDHEIVDAWYRSNGDVITDYSQRWKQVIDLHFQKYKESGLNVVSISPFNEPDYVWWTQGWTEPLNANKVKADFKTLAKALKEDEQYNGVRICGGNTIESGTAYLWWNDLKDYLDEGNTHQMAGSFDDFASFYNELRKANYHASADEVHNSVETMVGVQYGLQTAIWWGATENSRTQFMKATYQGDPGKRIGYAEHRGNWAAASVYRHTDGTVQAFGGTSERQAYNTTFGISCKDEAVWVNGVGPLREYSMFLPGGIGYWNQQTNAETVVNVQRGTDIQPAINGIYKIVNAGISTPMVLTVPGVGWGLENFACLKEETGEENQKWLVEPVPERIGGDFSYHFLSNRANLGAPWLLDVLDWGLDEETKTLVYPGTKGTNEQWYLKYAGDNCFYIVSRHSGLCLEPIAADGGYPIVTKVIDGNTSQMWKFIPADATFSDAVPSIPTNLASTQLPTAVQLDWTYEVNDAPNPAFEVMRTVKGKRDWTLIARGIEGTSFTDNSVNSGEEYQYKVRTVTSSFVRSDYSNIVSGSSTDQQSCIMELIFNDNVLDETFNGNHGALYGTAEYSKVDNDKPGQAISLGADSYIALPSNIASSKELTIYANVKWNGGYNWQRIFDFGNGTDQYFFLTPQSGSGMRLVLKNGGGEKVWQTTALDNEWHTIAVTLSDAAVTLYIDGEQVIHDTETKDRPFDFCPLFNYIGRSHYIADPMFNGQLQDFRIYNYALSAAELDDVATGIKGMSVDNDGNSLEMDILGRAASSNYKGIKISNGKKYINR